MPGPNGACAQVNRVHELGPRGKRALFLERDKTARSFEPEAQVRASLERRAAEGGWEDLEFSVRLPEEVGFGEGRQIDALGPCFERSKERSRLALLPARSQIFRYPEGSVRAEP
ncbi:MAG: hypothetical protein B6A08_03465 [Sorangiineae bacterium NIC37A_2]|nr:MAG: hypothetical protein B6A08_03465 [Sorangiineae bacterium NIC37A_2]